MPPLPYSPALTDVPPVVGVPCTLVVSKAQLHLYTVEGGGHTEGQVMVEPRYPGPISHPIYWARGSRVFGGKAGTKLMCLQRWAGVSLVSSSHRKQG